MAAILAACFCLPSQAQTHEWAWTGGTKTADTPGVYGAKGKPAAGNIPGGRDGAASWTDKSGHFWLLGGTGQDASFNGGNGWLNDFWEFNPSSAEWTWMGGSSTLPACTPTGCPAGWPGVYGKLGKSAAGNIPGARHDALAWTGSDGRFWLFGGEGVDSGGNAGRLNDLWEFDPSSGEWAWMGGSSSIEDNGGEPGVYGKLGTPAAGNIPGGREDAFGWTGSDGRLWLFGGNGYDASDPYPSLLNDLWVFNPSTNEWAWMGGSNLFGDCDEYGCGQSGVYGALGTPGPKNIPGGRAAGNSWIDGGGHFWLFGGDGFDANHVEGSLNDLWEFDPSTLEWTWTSGSSAIGGHCDQYGNCGVPGNYGTLGTMAAGNVPGGRGFASGWIDSGGHLWLFGGAGYDAVGHSGLLNDLWVFDPSTKEWGWMAGTSEMPCYNDCGQVGGYGTLGTPAAGNTPGGRDAALSWIDSGGHLRLFGGNGFDGGAVFRNLGGLNDFWEYWPSLSFSPPVTATPKLSQAAGTYTGLQTVSISDATDGAIIYYTTDGTLPTTGSSVYFGPVQIASTSALRAKATASGCKISALVGAKYIILKPQTIDFTPPASPVTFGVKPVLLKANASSGLAIVFSHLSGPATVQGDILTITGAGTVVVAANQAGNSVYAAAPKVMATIVVEKAAQTIAFTAPATPVVYGVKPIALSAKASSGLPVAFTVTGAAKVAGSTLTITGIGTVILHADQAGNGNYLAAPEARQTLTVQQAKLTVTANNLTMKKGAAVPRLTYKLSGFVNGDTQASATTGAPKLTTTATSASPAGSYPIKIAVGTLAARKYSLAFVNGTLTITP
jgi:N-acetylneuraminic acid mutarotase